MDTATLKKFAQGARRQLLEQVAARMEQVLRSDSVEIREKEKVVQELRQQIEMHGKKAVVDKVSYTWFNRFCALRFMDVNRYTRIGVVTPVEGGTQPEVLFDAKQGHIDDDLGKYVNHQVVFDLLSGKRPSSDAQGEAYRLLLVGICNYYGEFMPFMFEQIEDYTELLMPLDLLSENSVLHDLREALTPEACQDVEVIGWLYQYYISERKDEVFEALKKNQKIEAEDIPAATQLFTPHWIVRYLVENSLGRLWMLNHPSSRLTARMEYYIQPAQEETDFLRISNPEELRLLDPACGSGHILTYAFDLLAAIYEEEGYSSNDIPKLIVEKNIFGMEIDPRAGALSGFALAMKARAKDRRFFSRGVQPNICVLENVSFTDTELKQYMNAVGRDLFTEPLKETLHQFEQAGNFGSLIQPLLKDADYVRGILEGKNLGGDLFLYGVHERVLKTLNFAQFLAPRYHVLVTNPPYMGSGGMNEDLKIFASDFYPDSKSDTYAMFAERNIELVAGTGIIGMITLPNWMFLSSFIDFRKKLLSSTAITSLIHNGRGVWGSDFGSCSFILQKSNGINQIGIFKKLYVRQGEVNSNETLVNRFFDNKSFPKYQKTSKDFLDIPGAPVAYWLKDTRLFKKELIGDFFLSGGRNKTHDNEKYLRYFWEVSKNKTIWEIYANGGDFRRFYGNETLVVDWSTEAREFYASHGGLCNPKFWNKKGITWSLVTIAIPSFRIKQSHVYYSSGSPTIFREDFELDHLALGFLNSKVAKYYLSALNPTVNNTVNDIFTLPYQVKDHDSVIASNVKRLLEISKLDWDSFETSKEYSGSPLLKNQHTLDELEKAFSTLRANWREATLEMKHLEEINNSVIVKEYGLEGEVSPDVPFEEITLTCNPRYRYGGNRSEEELEELLCADTMREFISYAVGCMFGRYSLNKPGLVLANQGETLKGYLKQVPNPTFMPDEDNAIPALEGEWFNDDIAERFKKFLRITFGEEHYEKNLAFIEKAIGRDIRSYFVKEFYKDHVQMYKKRPIYWMFSSAKGSFNALIYIHRYKPDTVSIVLNNYLREYIKKLNAHKSQLERTSVSGSASQSQKTKALKEITQVNKILAELKDYEDDVLYPLATQRIAIDLDDGVKVNYGKFGKALSPIKGL